MTPPTNYQATPVRVTVTGTPETREDHILKHIPKDMIATFKTANQTQRDWLEYDMTNAEYTPDQAASALTFVWGCRTASPPFVKALLRALLLLC